VAQKVIRIGNGLGVTIPPEVAQAYGLGPGSLVVVEPTEEGFLVQAARIPSGKRQSTTTSRSRPQVRHWPSTKW